MNFFFLDDAMGAGDRRQRFGDPGGAAGEEAYDLDTNEVRVTIPYDAENERRRALAVAAGVTVRTYPDQAAFQRDAARLAAEYWAVSSVVERKPNAGCLRILFLWWLVLIFPPRPELLVTYRYEPPAVPKPNTHLRLRSVRASKPAAGTIAGMPGAVAASGGDGGDDASAAPTGAADAPTAARPANNPAAAAGVSPNPHPNLEPVTHRACFSCGAVVSIAHKFCPNCGAALGTRPPAAAAVPTPGNQRSPAPAVRFVDEPVPDLRQPDAPARETDSANPGAPQSGG